MEDEPKLKRCSRCKQWLPYAEFSSDKHAPDGLKYRCRECDSAYYRGNREKMLSYNRQWRLANPEKMRGYTAKWYAANVDKVRDYNQSDRGKEVRLRAMAKYLASEEGKAAALAYRQSERAKRMARERAAEWRRQNPEWDSELNRRYKKTEKGRLTGRVASIRRRARKAIIPGDHTSADVQKLLERCKRCHLCGKPFTKRNRPTLDHVLAVASNLGSNDPGNLALAHKSCNSKKRDLRLNPISGQGILL